MLTRILGHVQANKPRALVASLGQRELGVDNPHADLVRPTESLISVRALDNKVHAVTVAEVVAKERQQLHSLCLGLVDNLHAGTVGLPLLVDRDHATTPRDGKRRHDPAAYVSGQSYAEIRSSTYPS